MLLHVHMICIPGILLRMGVTQYPHVFDYWSTLLRMGPIADCMSRNRFWFLLRHLHFRDNNSVTTKEKEVDRLWKMRIWFNMLHERIGLIPPLQYLAVDEQMIPYKGMLTWYHTYMKSGVEEKAGVISLNRVLFFWCWCRIRFLSDILFDLWIDIGIILLVFVYVTV